MKDLPYCHYLLSTKTLIRYVTDSHWHHSPYICCSAFKWSTIFLSDIHFPQRYQVPEAWPFWTGAKVYWLHILCPLVETCLYFRKSNIHQQEGLHRTPITTIGGRFQWRKSGQTLTQLYSYFFLNLEKKNDIEEIAWLVQKVLSLDSTGSGFCSGYTVSHLWEFEQSLFLVPIWIHFFLHHTPRLKKYSNKYTARLKTFKSWFYRYK